MFDWKFNDYHIISYTDIPIHMWYVINRWYKRLKINCINSIDYYIYNEYWII